MSISTSQFFKLESSYELAFPDNLTERGLNSPATTLLIDFRLHPPATLYMDDSLDEAKSFLGHAHLSVMAVVDQYGHFRGLLTRDQLSDEAIMRRLFRGQHRKELQVRDLMVPRSQLTAIDYGTLASLSIDKFVTLLYEEGRSYVLVVDRHSQRIRGLISAAELAQRLGLSHEARRKPTFMDIFAAVMH